MVMKKIIFYLITVLCLCAAVAHAGGSLIFSGVTYNYDYGPFCITESNEACLGNGSCFASVYIINDYQIPSSTATYQFLIIVVPNTSLLQPLSNYGVKRFGLNYNGRPTELTLKVLKGVGDNTVDSKWKLKTNYDPTLEEPHGSSFGPFGIFVYDDSTTGQYIKNPLLLHIATDVPGVDVYDFYTSGSKYVFACHIIDFYYSGCGSSISSAYFAMNVPVTLIELASFNVKTGAGKVVLSWSTASEIDNAGFNIYRAEAQDGQYEKINSALIPAEGSAVVGADYEFIDENVKLWKKYYYVLEDIDINGNATAHTEVIVSAMPRLIDYLTQ